MGHAQRRPGCIKPLSERCNLASGDEFVLGKKRFIVVAAGCMCVRKIIFVHCCFSFLVFFLVRLRESPSELRWARV